MKYFSSDLPKKYYLKEGNSKLTGMETPTGKKEENPEMKTGVGVRCSWVKTFEIIVLSLDFQCLLYFHRMMKARFNFPR
jgi:hypothetical protein